MAETAAHFTATSNVNPSIFEILAQDSLQNTLHPALQRIALFAATSSPKRFKWLVDYYDEVFLLLNALLQHHYLKHYSASFAENFYGLKRVTLSDQKLTKGDLKLSLLMLVAVPYLVKKLESRLQLYRFEHEDNCFRDQHFKKFLLHAQSAIQFGWNSWLIINYLRYMSGKTQSQLPGLSILGLKLQYDNENHSLSNFWGSLLRGQLSFSEVSFGLVRNAVGSTLELAAFFMQFLQAWGAEKANYDVTALPTVQPPSPDNQAESFKGKCPICLQHWKIPTILPVSGYVFCFPCILKHLRENERCPVTDLPAKPLDIVRLYDNE